MDFSKISIIKHLSVIIPDESGCGARVNKPYLKCENLMKLGVVGK